MGDFCLPVTFERGSSPVYSAAGVFGRDRICRPPPDGVPESDLAADQLCRVLQIAGHVSDNPLNMEDLEDEIRFDVSPMDAKVDRGGEEAAGLPMLNIYTPRVNRYDLLVAQHTKHFVLPIPYAFLKVGAKSRGEISNNAFAQNILKLASALDFLFSKDGLEYMWMGRFSGSKLPVSLYTRIRNARDEKAKPKDFEVADYDYPHTLDTGPFKDMIENEIEYLVQDGYRGHAEAQGDRLAGATTSLTMDIVPAGGAGYGVEKHVYERRRIYWEFVPRFQPNPQFQDLAKLFVPGDAGDEDVEAMVNMLKRTFPSDRTMDKNSEIGCLLMHYVVLDPRISVMKGLSNLWACKMNLTKKMQNTKATHLAAHLAVPAITYKNVISCLYNNGERDIAREFESVGEDEIYSAKSVLPIETLLSVRPISLDAESRPRPSDFQRCFVYSKFVARQFNVDLQMPGAISIGESPQLDFASSFYGYRLYREGDMVEESVTGLVHLFYAPVRVVEIPASCIHPFILNTCVFPMYNRHLSNTVNVEFETLKTRGHSVWDIMSWNYTCPRMKPTILQNFETMVLAKCDLYSTTCKGEPSVVKVKRDFTVDHLRTYLGAKPDAEILCTIGEMALQTAPVTIVNEIFSQLTEDIEQDVPNLPDQMVRVITHMKKLRKETPGFSLFQDPFETLAWKHYSGLSIMSTAEVNFFEFLDYEMATRHCHSLAHLLQTVLLGTARLRFREQLTLIFAGTPDSGKSHAKLLLAELDIPEMFFEQDSATAKVIESGADIFAGAVVYQDDGGVSNSDIHSKDAQEQNTNNTMKGAMTQGRTIRSKFVKNANGDEEVRRIYTDLRRTMVICSNDFINLVGSMQSRVWLKLVMMSNRFMSVQALRGRAGEIPVSRNRKNAYAAFMQREHIFVTLLLLYVRSGAVRYNADVEGFKLAKPYFERFVQATKTITGDSNASGLDPLPNRTVIAQVYPFAEMFAARRLFFNITVGAYPNNEYLRPGAPFNYQMLREIDKYKLYLVNDEDMIRALSYFEDVIARDALAEVLNYLKNKLNSKNVNFSTGIRRMAGQPDYGPAGQFMFLLCEMGSGGRLTVDGDWLNLTALCSLPTTDRTIPVVDGTDRVKDESLTYLAEQIQAFTKSSNNDDVGRMRIEDTLQLLLTTPYEARRREVPGMGPEGGQQVLNVMGGDPENGGGVGLKTRSMVLEFHMAKVAADKDTQKVLRIRLAWLAAQLTNNAQQRGVGGAAGSMKKHTAHSSLYPGPGTDELFNFTGSVADSAMLLMSHKGAFPLKITLPGMTLSGVRASPSETRRITSMPHAMRTVEIVDLNKPSPVADHFRRHAGGALPEGLVVGTNPVTLVPTIFTPDIEGHADGTSPLEEEYDHYPTIQWQLMLEDTCRRYGVVDADGVVVADRAGIDRYLVETADWYKDYSPLAPEIRFKKMREEYEVKQGTVSLDYPKCVVDKEIQMANMNAAESMRNAKEARAYTAYAFQAKRQRLQSQATQQMTQDDLPTVRKDVQTRRETEPEQEIPDGHNIDDLIAEDERIEALERMEID
jgi:hypothetical protein